MDEAMLKSGQYPNVAILAGTDPAEVMREHGRVDNGAEADSREKLEADAENLLFEFGHYCATSREGLTDDVYVFIGDFTDLLDRQAAITAREHPGLTISDDESLINWRGENYMLQSRVLNAELERDEFSLKLKHEMELNRDNRNALDLERIAELTAERDQLSRDLEAEHALVVQFEHDNEELRHANNTLRASVAGLKSTVEKLKAADGSGRGKPGDGQ